MTFAELKIRVMSPSRPEVRALLAELDGYLNYLYAEIHNPFPSVEQLCAENVTFLVAELGNQLIGCGALVRHVGWAEVKRMMVVPGARGKGVGRKLLHALEMHAAACECPVIRLETGIHQQEAVAMYEREGYRRIEAFADYVANGNSVFMEKQIP